MSAEPAEAATVSLPTRSLSVVLLGPGQQENLALQYVAASATRAGHRVRVIPYNYRADLDPAVTQALAESPDLIGLGIAFQNNIQDYLVLVRALREAGYRGHITAGGHVPTFCYEELLRDLPELDTIVRHDGEDTLVEVLALIANEKPVRDVAGLVWREDDGVKKGPGRSINFDLDSLAWPCRSEKRYTVGGLTVDFLITARGCVGECNYCSIAAYTSEQQKRFRLRKPEQVAAEIEWVHRTRDARVVFVQDDLFVLPSEKRTIERTERMRAELDARGVDDVVFWVKGRPETLTPAVAAALRKMGVIHVFLGVESSSPERLEYLGRTHQPDDNTRAIRNCRDAGIVPSFNFMLFDPDCTLADIEATLRLADDNVDLPWNLCRTEIYSGTALRDRLEREGRLSGDYRSYGYRMADEHSELLFRILRVSLHERALAIESLLNRLISLSFARQLHETYFPGAQSEALGRVAHEIGVEARRDTLRAVREAMRFVESDEAREPGRLQRFAVQQALAINSADRERLRRTEELWQHFSLRGATLMAQRGLRLPTETQGHFGVASGS